MENNNVINSNFGRVPCGQKRTETVQIKNTSKRTQVLAVSNRCSTSKLDIERLQIYPVEIMAKPGQTVRFILSYISHVENLIENYSYEIQNSKEVVAQLNIRAQTVGPSITPTVFNLKFFRIRGLDKTVKQVNLTNTANCEAKFFFDLDEDSEELDISQRSGIIPACHKLGLKFTFKPLAAGIFYKKIFCIVQFHDPIIFNVLAVYNPRLKLQLNYVTFSYPPETNFQNTFEAYVAGLKAERQLGGEVVRLSEKFSQEFEIALKGSGPRCGEEFLEEKSSSFFQHMDSVSEAEINSLTENILLITSYLNIGNSAEVPKATSLVNLSRNQQYYYEWGLDPKNHFQLYPCKGVLKPNSKTYFNLSFTPSVLDFMYHAELDVKIFPCLTESELDMQRIIHLPLTLSLRIIGNSFPDDSCGWVAQCKVTPKSLHFRACVPGEIVSGTFLIERQGHLPVTFHVIPPKERSFIVQPVLGYLSKSFQLIVVQFSSESKDPGVYTEDIKIQFNNSDSSVEAVKLCARVEIPILILETDDSVTFSPVAPGARSSKNVRIENPTNLNLRYEFVIPEGISWVEVANPKGSIDPKDFLTIKVVFKPNSPGEYLDYIPCFVSSASGIECTQTVYLQLIGSCQFGCLVATPSVYDFGNCIINEKKSLKIHLFNFSPIVLYFQLTPIHVDFPMGNPERDVTVTPREGRVLGKSSLEVNVRIKAHDMGNFRYALECQNVGEDSRESAPIEDSRKIFHLKFEGVLQVTQVVDVAISNGGPLFSPHWLWKMTGMDRINEALRSMTKLQWVKMSVPDGMEEAESIHLYIVFESGVYGDMLWDYKVEIICPCLEGSTRNFQEGLECVHTKAVFYPSTAPKLGPKMRLVVEIMIKYEEPTDCEVRIIITSRLKTVTLRIPVTVLPKEKPSCASFYVDQPFSMKPVFIGDPNPPIQLFWIYNNTQFGTSYRLDKMFLGEPGASTPKIFDCINPFGIIPPFSSLPLAFVFSPKETKEYTANVTLFFQDSKSRSLRLTGTGILNFNQFQELALGKTVPKKPLVHSETLEFSDRNIFIPFMRTFSDTSRLFFLRNTSKKHKWAFRWHSFHTENIFHVNITPEKGVINPGETELMTLYVQSFCHPTTISTSVPCDVLNYSQLKEHKETCAIRQIKEEEAEEYFTITEKGETYEIPNVTIVPEPKPHHIFLTVNVNLVSNLNIDLKLSPKQQATIQAEREICDEVPLNDSLKPSVVKFNQELLEKLLWNALCSSSVAKSIKRLDKTQDYMYLELVTETIKTREASLKRIETLPNKNYLQRLLETTMKEVLCKNFIPRGSSVNSFE